MNDEIIPMAEIRRGWVEFMTTFNGKQSAPFWERQFDASLELFYDKAYDMGRSDAYDNF